MKLTFFEEPRQRLSLTGAVTGKFMTQKACKTDNDKQVFDLGQEGYLELARLTNHERVSYTWGKAQMLTDLTRFKKAEAVDATPQDLSIVLRWAGGMRVLAGPATLD